MTSHKIRIYSANRGHTLLNGLANAKIAKSHILLFLFDSLRPSQCRDASSWVEPVLSMDKCVLLKDTTQ